MTEAPTYSIQVRCPNMAKHGPDNPFPCDECYSLLVIGVRIPYQPNVRWTDTSTMTPKLRAKIADAVTAPGMTMIRPLKKVRSGEWRSNDGHWTFIHGRLTGADGANYICWHIFEDGIDDAWGDRCVTLDEAVRNVQFDLDWEARKPMEPVPHCLPR